ncbi:unnamed protein product [Victoria cruziana]
MLDAGAGGGETEPPSFGWWQQEMRLPEVLSSEGVKRLHASIEEEWDSVERTACQTAASRALWKHVIRDPLAEILAGEKQLRILHGKVMADRLNNAREIAGVMLAVRTLWFDCKLEAAVESLRSLGEAETQVVLLGAGMDARAYRLKCLKESSVFEVDSQKLIQMKAELLKAAATAAEQEGSFWPEVELEAKSLTRVGTDIRGLDWLETLQRHGFSRQKGTVWVLEGILYYLQEPDAMHVLRCIAANCGVAPTVLLADFMNQHSTSLSRSAFHFYSDWPEELLPSLGFSTVALSQIGDPDADFGLVTDPCNLFNRVRRVPRTAATHPEDGTPCRRLFLVQATGSPTSSPHTPRRPDGSSSSSSSTSSSP